MLFKNLKSGEKFIYRCAVNDERISVYIKLETAVKLNGLTDELKDPLISVSYKGGSFQATRDDTEVIALY